MFWGDRMPRHRYSAHLDEEDERPAAGLTRGDGLIIQMARRALGETIEQLAPDNSNKVAIAAVAIAGMFADLVGGLSTSSGIVAVINQQLAGTGWQLVPLRRN